MALSSQKPCAQAEAWCRVFAGSSYRPDMSGDVKVVHTTRRASLLSVLAEHILRHIGFVGDHQPRKVALLRHLRRRVLYRKEVPAQEARSCRRKRI